MRIKIWLDIVQRLLELTGTLRPLRSSEAIIPARWYRSYCALSAAILLSSFVMAVGYAMSADVDYIDRLQATIFSFGVVKSVFIICWFIRSNSQLLYVLLDLQTKFGNVTRIRVPWGRFPMCTVLMSFADFLHGRVPLM